MNRQRGHLPCLLASVALIAGCTSVTGGRPRVPSGIRTVTTIGDRTLPVASGEAGSAATASVATPTPEPEPDRRISGRVLDENGEPVPDATVRVAVDGRASGRAIQARTDATGRFALTNLRSGSTYSLIAEWEDQRGELQEGRAVIEAPSRNVDIRLASVTSPDAPATRRVSKRDETEEIDEAPVAEAAEDLPGASGPVGSSNDEDEPVTPFDGEAGDSQEGGDEGAGGLASAGSWRRGDDTDQPDPAAEDRAPATATPVEPPVSPYATHVVPEEDEGPNPLPPALERSDVAADPDPVPSLDPGPSGSPSPPPPPFPPDPEPLPSVPAGPEPVGPASTGAPSAALIDEALAAPPDTAANGVAPDAPDFPTLEDDPPIAPEPDHVPESSPTTPSPSVPAGDTSAPEPEVPTNPFSDGDPDGSAAPSESAARWPTWGEIAPAGRAVPTLASEAEISSARMRTSTASRRPREDGSKPVDPQRAIFCEYDARKRRLEDFSLPDLEGRPVRFRDLDADLVLLDFWGTWCGPCVRSIPHLVELQRHYGNRLKVVGIAYEQGTAAENVTAVAATARRLGVNYTVLLGGTDDRPCPVQTQLQVQVYPTMILVDRQGQVVWRDQGATPETLARLDRAIASELRPDIARR